MVKLSAHVPKKAKKWKNLQRCCVSDISSETPSRCQAIGPSSCKEGPMSRSSRATRIRAFRSEVDPLLDTGRLESKFGKSQVFTSKTSVLTCGKSKLILKLRPSLYHIICPFMVALLHYIRFLDCLHMYHHWSLFLAYHPRIQAPAHLMK